MGKFDHLRFEARTDGLVWRPVQLAREFCRRLGAVAPRLSGLEPAPSLRRRSRELAAHRDLRLRERSDGGDLERRPYPHPPVGERPDASDWDSGAAPWGALSEPLARLPPPRIHAAARFEGPSPGSRRHRTPGPDPRRPDVDGGGAHPGLGWRGDGPSNRSCRLVPRPSRDRWRRACQEDGAVVRALRAGALAASLLLVPPAQATGVHWNDCVRGGGLADRRFSCDTNVGAHDLVVTLDPGVDRRLRALRIEVDFIAAAGETLPPWWDLGGCRYSLFEISTDFTDPPYEAGICRDVWAGEWADVTTTFLKTSPRIWRLRIEMVPALETGVELKADAENLLCRIRIYN